MYAAILLFAGWLGRCASNTSYFQPQPCGTDIFHVTVHSTGQGNTLHTSPLTQYFPYLKASARRGFTVVTTFNMTR
jgi:hypothetical protein